MSAHTPGPWMVLGLGSSTKTRYIDAAAIEDDREDYIARVSHKDGETADANARLIAAVTDLLALAMRTERWVVEVEARQIAAGERTSHSQFIDDLRATIAKATGEAQ